MIEPQNRQLCQLDVEIDILICGNENAYSEKQQKQKPSEKQQKPKQTKKKQQEETRIVYYKHEANVISAWFDDSKPLYKKILDAHKDAPEFVFMDGPPFVSGNLHIGHLAVSYIKSSVLIYKIAQGYKCKYKLGYDTHGLPIEMLVSKENDLKNEQIRSMGLEQFNKLCDMTVTKYANMWTPIFKSIGRLADFNDVYMTRDLEFMESCIWAFKQLWDKGLVYKAQKIMAYSYGCQTPLSNFEVSQGYIDVEAKTVFVGFELDESNDTSSIYKTYLVAWTTMPWTLVANLGICVGDDIDYVEITITKEALSLNAPHYVVGKHSANAVFGKGKYTVLREYKGCELVGVHYKPIFPYMDNVDVERGITRKYKVVSDSYVKVDDVGTSIVHLAPGFGEDDFRICSYNNIVDNVSVINYCPVDTKGCFTGAVLKYKDRLVFDTNDNIIDELKSRGILMRTLMYAHKYPHCYRTDTPLIYRCMDSFYIKVTELKDRMIELNNQVNWFPSEMGTGRFGNWLETTKDWPVSRFRFYGTPIPVWIADDGEMICIGSIKELIEETGVKDVQNLHPEFVNKMTITKNGKIFRRTPDILDCWFESGAASFAQHHFPFSGIKIQQPDLIIEGIDQTRGWFYTLMVLSVAIFDSIPYKNVMCVGLVLDQDGNKISKRNGNFVDPNILIEKYGRDLLRLYLIKSPLIHGDPLKFDEESLNKLQGRLIPFINAVKFWIDHTTNYQHEVLGGKNIEMYVLTLNDVVDGGNLMDVWLLEKIVVMGNAVNDFMGKYELAQAVETLLDFIDDLTNWYIKLNRSRLRGLNGNEEWHRSIHVLYSAIMQYSIMSAPFMPFLCEHIFSRVKVVDSKFSSLESILFCEYPKNSTFVSKSTAMEMIQKVCRLVRYARSKSSKHKQQVIPLDCCTVYHSNSELLEEIKTNISIVQGELNVMNVLFRDIAQNVEYKIIPNYQAIAENYPDRAMLKRVREMLSKLNSDQIESVFKGNALCCEENEINPVCYTIQRIPKNMALNEVGLIDRELMVSIDQTYNETIHHKFTVRYIHSVIQDMRKNNKIRPWNNIVVYIENTYVDQAIVTDLEGMLTNATICVVNSVTSNNIIEHEINNKYFVGAINITKYDGLTVVGNIGMHVIG